MHLLATGNPGKRENRKAVPYPIKIGTRKNYKTKN